MFIFVFLSSIQSFAGPDHGWSLGVGYHNPPGSTIGVNFMHLWTNWALELGIGYIGSYESENNNASNNQNNSSASDRDKVIYTVAGGINLKYLFGSGPVRPYLQGGLATFISTSNSGTVGAGASLNDPFGGFGIFFSLGKEAYLYVSYLLVNTSTLQIGVGF